MSLTFKSKAAFKHALKTWAWINQSEEKRFILIANHAGCGPDDQRQSYMYANPSTFTRRTWLIGSRITKIKENESKLTTFLTAEPVGWDRIAGTYDMDFGQAAINKAAKSRRGIFDDIADLGGDAIDGIKDIGNDIGEGVGKGIDAVQDGIQDLGDKFASIGDVNFDKSATFSIAVGQPNQVTNIVDQSFLKLDCLNCFVTGSFQLTGHLSVSKQHSLLQT